MAISFRLFVPRNTSQLTPLQKKHRRTMSNPWNARFGLGHSLRFDETESGLVVGRIESDLCTGRVFLQGAHIAEFQPFHSEHPVLFLSSQSLFAREKAIRGGVPICFPWFGAHPMDAGQPAHGLARIRNWELLETRIESGDIVLRMGLDLPPFAIRYSVRFGKSLRYCFEVTNRSSSQQTFELALHTYLRLGDVHRAVVMGLEQVPFLDQLTGQVHSARGIPIRFTEETDRIYQGAAKMIVVEDPVYRRRVMLQSSDSQSTIVWNPWIAKSKRMADFGDDEYLTMCCIETANVRENRIEIGPEANHSTMVEVSVESMEKTT